MGGAFRLESRGQFPSHRRHRSSLDTFANLSAWPLDNFQVRPRPCQNCVLVQFSIGMGRSFDTKAFVSIALVCGSCGGTPSVNSGHQKQPLAGSSNAPEGGAGTLLYVRHQLTLLQSNDAQRFISVVVGLSNLEVLDKLADGRYSSQLIARPSTTAKACPGAPIAFAIDDVNADSVDDILVMDTCGNWVALGDSAGGYQSASLDPSLQPLNAWESFASITFGDTLHMLIGGNDTGGGFVTRETSEELFGHFADFRLSASPLNVKVTHTFVAVNSGLAGEIQPLIYYQGAGSLQVMQRSGNGLSMGPTLSPLSIQAPYLLPFSGFDHISALEPPGCTAAALGVGVFGTDVKGIARALQWIGLSDAGLDTREIKTSAEVVTFATVHNGQDTLVGVVERAGSAYSFAVYKVTNCNEFKLLGEEPVDFDWRMPPAPSFGAKQVPKTDGLQLVGMADSSPSGTTYRFYHYDGYNLRIFSVEFATDTPEQVGLSEEEVGIHDTRTDLAF